MSKDLAPSKDYDFDVFISYSSVDRNVVLPLAERLKADGVEVWLDVWNVDPGEAIPSAVSNGLRSSRRVAFCMTPSSVASKWAELERHIMMYPDPSNRIGSVIPVLLADCEVPVELKHLRYVDLTSNDGKAYDELLRVFLPLPREPANAFHYPDTGEEITQALIARIEPSPGYWSFSEEVMKRKFLGPNLALLQGRRQLQAIDVGSGYGRLVHWLLDFGAANLTVVEPDAGRCEIAKSAVNAEQRPRVVFVNEIIENFSSSRPFDLVFVSHVLQHVSRKSLREMVGKLRDICAQNGKLVLLTTHAGEAGDRFTIASVNAEGKNVEETVTAELFDQLCMAPSPGRLPVRFFSVQTIEKELDRAGFRMEAHYVFHCCENVFGELDNYCFRDDLVNSLPELKERLGRDIAIVATPC